MNFLILLLLLLILVVISIAVLRRTGLLSNSRGILGGMFGEVVNNLPDTPYTGFIGEASSTMYGGDEEMEGKTGGMFGEVVNNLPDTPYTGFIGEASSTMYGGKEEKDCLKKHYETIRRRIGIYNPQNKDNIIVQFHTTAWCPYCQKMTPIWNKLMEHVNNNPDFVKYTFLEQDQDECNAPGINKIPKIYKYVGDDLIEYKGYYDYDKLLDFVLNA